VFRCMKSGCPWYCGTRKLAGCADHILARSLAFVLWVVLIGSLVVGALSMN
jgi:hypothetical protein